jgi:hypothetical protein
VLLKIDVKPLAPLILSGDLRVEEESVISVG